MAAMNPSSRESELDFAALIADISGGAHGASDLDSSRAFALFAAMLADTVPALELGAILVALRIKGESLAEMIAFVRALEASVARLETAADRPRPAILASYGATREHPGSMPLLALLLRRYGVPVLIHGLGRGDTRAVGGSHAEASDSRQGGAAVAPDTTLELLLELGIEPAHGLADAQRILAQHRIAYVPVTVLAPGLATLLGHGARLGGRSLPATLAPLLDPFGGDGYRVVGLPSPEQTGRMRELLIATRARALLLPATAGESFAQLHHPLQIETFVDGVGTVCAEKEICPPDDENAVLPAADDASATAAWITEVLAGSIPVPPSIITELACCLQGTRRPVVAE